MRGRRNREVNIFSASVVDLFASGLGVFLIVAIIALVNQKKETSRALNGGQVGTVIESPRNENRVGEQQNFASADDPLISDLETELEKLKIQLSKKTQENLSLKKQIYATEEVVESSKKSDSSLEFRIATIKAEHKRQQLELRESKENLEILVKDQTKLISELRKELSDKPNAVAKGKEGVGINFNEFEIGSRFKLKNVHFYPGTERAIEPYASQEVRDLSVFLNSHPKVSVEISGHIFETKKAIEKGKAEDVYNLSGRRSEYVCNKLVEFGVNRKRLRCLGYGATRPLYLTDDQYSEEAQLNRRVEVEILSK